ncbi:MAG TPA: hypothetical protein VHC69_00365 [Polyangiaceae bacterium]|nr:hypothetical protein [Polyangiaceae bacterium]
MASLRAHLVLAFGCVHSLLGNVDPAHAEELSAPDASGARAHALFREARDLARSGDYEHACPKFEESRRLRPSIATDFNVADCWEHIGRVESAHELFLRVAAVTHDLGEVEREHAARARAEALEARLSTSSAAVPVSSSSECADTKQPSLASPAPARAGDPPQRSTTPRWILLGVAGAGAVTASVAFAFFAHDDSAARDICRSGLDCPDSELARHREFVDGARTSRAVGIAGLAVAGASLLGATVFFVREREHDSRAGASSRTTWTGKVAATPGGASAVFGGTF